jgi:hypothetical protein
MKKGSLATMVEDNRIDGSKRGMIRDTVIIKYYYIIMLYLHPLPSSLTNHPFHSQYLPLNLPFPSSRDIFWCRICKEIRVVMARKPHPPVLSPPPEHERLRVPILNAKLISCPKMHALAWSLSGPLNAVFEKHSDRIKFPSMRSKTDHGRDVLFYPIHGLRVDQDHRCRNPFGIFYTAPVL